MLAGIADAGDRVGCVLLAAGGRQYLLVAPPGRQLPLGVPIRVRAQRLTGVSGYCQQGIPVRVLAVSRR